MAGFKTLGDLLSSVGEEPKVQLDFKDRQRLVQAAVDAAKAADFQGTKRLLGRLGMSFAELKNSFSGRDLATAEAKCNLEDWQAWVDSDQPWFSPPSPPKPIAITVGGPGGSSGPTHSRNLDQWIGGGAGGATVFGEGGSGESHSSAIFSVQPRTLQDSIILDDLSIDEPTGPRSAWSEIYQVPHGREYRVADMPESWVRDALCLYIRKENVQKEKKQSFGRMALVLQRLAEKKAQFAELNTPPEDDE